MWQAWKRGEAFTGFWLGGPKVRDHWEDLGVDEWSASVLIPLCYYLTPCSRALHLLHDAQISNHSLVMYFSLTSSNTEKRSHKKLLYEYNLRYAFRYTSTPP
jgi:hypothetical protein